MHPPTCSFCSVSFLSASSSTSRVSLAELRWTEAAVTEERLAAAEFNANGPLEGTADRAVAPFGTPVEVMEIEDGGEAVERRVAAALLDVLARDAAVVDAIVNVLSFLVS
jgi:hypothetical protein